MLYHAVPQLEIWFF